MSVGVCVRARVTLELGEVSGNMGEEGHQAKPAQEAMPSLPHNTHIHPKSTCFLAVSISLRKHPPGSAQMTLAMHVLDRPARRSPKPPTPPKSVSKSSVGAGEALLLGSDTPWESVGPVWRLDATTPGDWLLGDIND